MNKYRRALVEIRRAHLHRVQKERSEAIRAASIFVVEDQLTKVDFEVRRYTVTGRMSSAANLQNMPKLSSQLIAVTAFEVGYDDGGEGSG
jgi:hypothetical protein